MMRMVMMFVTFYYVLLCCFSKFGLYEPDSLKPVYTPKIGKTRVVPKTAYTPENAIPQKRLSLKTPTLPKQPFYQWGVHLLQLKNTEYRTLASSPSASSQSTISIYPIRGGPIGGYSKQA
jgi:hypothetical protein